MSTADNYVHRLDQLFRLYILYLDPEEPTCITTDEADDFELLLAKDEIRKQYGDNQGEVYDGSSKRKFSNTLEKYALWRYKEGELEFEWKSRINFDDGESNSAYRFSYRELGKVFQSADEYHSLPSRDEVSTEEREEIDALVAERLGKPKAKVIPRDWICADCSAKVSSLVRVAYDAGLSPKEVENAETHWYDPDEQILRIPTEESSKQREKEEVALSDETAERLEKWLKERRLLEKYDGTNKIWLNRWNNPYNSANLCNLITNLCEEAGIETEGRKIVWYSLRHTLGRYMTAEGELEETNDQLRHDTLATTQERYNQTPVEKRRQTLNTTQSKAERAAKDPDFEPFGDDESEEEGRE